MRKKPIKLTVKDRVALEKFSTTGVHNVRLVNRAKIILALDISGGRTAQRHEAIAERLGIPTPHSTHIFAALVLLRKPLFGLQKRRIPGTLCAMMAKIRF